MYLFYLLCISDMKEPPNFGLALKSSVETLRILVYPNVVSVGHSVQARNPNLPPFFLASLTKLIDKVFGASFTNSSNDM
jgi:hypothetical protein